MNARVVAPNFKPRMNLPSMKSMHSIEDPCVAGSDVTLVIQWHYYYRDVVKTSQVNLLWYSYALDKIFPSYTWFIPMKYDCNVGFTDFSTNWLVSALVPEGISFETTYAIDEIIRSITVDWGTFYSPWRISSTQYSINYSIRPDNHLLYLKNHIPAFYIIR